MGLAGFGSVSPPQDFFRLLAGFGSVSPPQDFFVSLLGSGVSVLHRIFSSPFWVRECQSSTGFFRLLFWVREFFRPPQDFFVAFLGSGVSVLHRIFSSPCWVREC